MSKVLGAIIIGLLGGLVLGAGLAARWPKEIATAISDPNTTAWLSALGGAALGGGISYVLARSASRETLRRDEATRRQIEHAGSLRTSVIAMQMTNRIFTINRSLEEASVLANKEARELWVILKASTGAGSSVEAFYAVDFVPFIKSGNSDLVHRCNLLGEKLNALEAAMKIYGDKRQEWQAFAEPYTTVDSNGTSTTKLEGQAAAVAKLKAYEMNNLAGQMLELSRDYLAFANAVCGDLDAAHQGYFGKEAGFRLAVGPLGNEATSGRRA